MAELERLIFTLLSKGLSDSSFPEIDCGSLGLNHDEQHRLDKYRHFVSPVFRKTEHLNLSQETLLPFLKREPTDRHGSFGQIFKVEVADGHLEGYSKSTVAEKLIHWKETDDEQTVLREADTLRQREHPSIVPLLASYTLKSMESEVAMTTVHLILPFAEMDLKNWMIRSQPPAWLQQLPKPECRAHLYRFIYALVSGLSFLHREKDGRITAHHDLKPRNILVFGQELKIADFGRSHLRSLAEGSETEGKSGLGTYEYHPPEYWNDNGSCAEVKHGRAFDAWSMGCIIIEIAILIVYGWESEKVTEFRNQRLDNPKKERLLLAEKRTPDCSFHNNWAVVEKCIDQLQVEDDSPRLKSTLGVAMQMMTQTPSSRLYAWEAELDLHKIYQPNDDRVTRLEKGALCIQPPPQERKILNGTQTPLHRAAQKGDSERLDQLLKAGWSPDVKDHKGLTALEVFNQSQDYSSRNSLYERLDPKTPEKATNEEQGRKLLQAASRGQVEVVQDLLAQGVDAMFVNEEGHSALHNAVIYRQFSVATCLLQTKGKELLKQKDIKRGDTPLHKAALFGHASILEQLLEHSPDIEDQRKDGKTALFLAVLWGREEAVEVLLKHGAQVFTRQDPDGTLLHIATQYRHFEVLKRLLRADDADKCLEHKDMFGQTPLLLALSQENFECAQILFDKGASLRESISSGNNVLHAAVDQCLYDSVEKEIDQFLPDEIDSRNQSNDTPLMIAEREKKDIFVEILTRRRDRA